MPVIICTRATFVKKEGCLVARVVSFDTEDTFHILETESSKNIEFGLSHIMSH